MAIIKSMNSKFGLSLSYHRITAISLNFVTHQVVVCVASYLSKEARASQSVPLEEIDIEIPKGDYSLFLNSSPLPKAYLWLKANVVGFEDATDDFDVMESFASGEVSSEAESPVEG